MPPRWNSYDESSDFVDLSRDSTSPDVTKTEHILYKTKRFVQPAKRQGNTSGHSSRPFQGSQSTSTSTAIPTAPASQLSNSKPTSHPNAPCFTCIIEDNNPYVQYNGVWTLNGPQVSTTHSTTVSGSTISLRFNGSAIFVFGTVPASNDTFQPPTAVYLLDNDPPFSTTLPRATKAIPNQPLFASPTRLSNDEHQLVINITDGEAPYSLARFFVFPSESPEDMIGQIPSGGIVSTSISSTSFVTSVTSPTPQIAPATSSSAISKEASQKTVRTLAVVLATILLLALTGTIVFFIFRRRIIAKRRLAGEISPASRPDTEYSFFTSTESIRRNDSDFWASSFCSPRSQHSRSGRSFGSRSFSDYAFNGRRSTIDFAPPPLPPKPKPALLASSTKPG